MSELMPDSQLNGAEQRLQHSFMKGSLFNSLLMACAVGAACLLIRALPNRRPMPDVTIPIAFKAVRLDQVAGPFRLAGAWKVEAGDRRFGGLSALALDQGRFVAVSDLGAAIRFDRPTVSSPLADIKDLRSGPGVWGKKWARDAESLALDPKGKGWWIGYEQRHYLWLYDRNFSQALASVNLNRKDWWDNRGAEGLIADGGDLLVIAENGREAMRVGPSGTERIQLGAGADVAEAARAPDGSIWLLLRSKGRRGIEQQVAPLIQGRTGYIVGAALPVPKAALDNFEGMTIEPLPDGGWRFWLVSDNGHRLMARTLLVALDFKSAKQDKARREGRAFEKIRSKTARAGLRPRPSPSWQSRA